MQSVPFGCGYKRANDTLQTTLHLATSHKHELEYQDSISTKRYSTRVNSIDIFDDSVEQHIDSFTIDKTNDLKSNKRCYEQI